MHIVTLWESQMKYWGTGKPTDPDQWESKVRSSGSHMYYVSRDRAAEASPGGPPIERKVIERDGLYFMLTEPRWNSEAKRIPTNEEDMHNIAVFIGSDPYDDTISSIPWEEEMLRRGRTLIK